MGRPSISFFNHERYADPTACFALRNILRDEEAERRKKKAGNRKRKKKAGTGMQGAACRKPVTRTWKNVPAEVTSA